MDERERKIIVAETLTEVSMALTQTPAAGPTAHWFAELARTLNARAKQCIEEAKRS